MPIMALYNQHTVCYLKGNNIMLNIKAITFVPLFLIITQESFSSDLFSKLKREGKRIEEQARAVRDQVKADNPKLQGDAKILGAKIEREVRRMRDQIKNAFGPNYVHADEVKNVDTEAKITQLLAVCHFENPDNQETQWLIEILKEENALNETFLSALLKAWINEAELIPSEVAYLNVIIDTNKKEDSAPTFDSQVFDLTLSNYSSKEVLKVELFKAIIENSKI